MKYTNLSEDDMDVVQKFAFGGIANPVQRPYLRSADREFLNARQAELDAFEEQRLAYNTALQDWQTNVYQPYQQQVGAYNTELDKYKAEVFNPYQEQVNAYNTAAEQYNTEVYNPYKEQYSAYERALNEYNAGPRTSDYAGPAAPTLARNFDMTAPTAPTPFGMTAPEAPKDFDLSAPVLPFKEEDIVARQQQAAETARKDAGNRALAIDVVSDPNRFNFGSMSVSNRFMAEGGPVNKSSGPSARDMLDGMSDPKEDAAVRRMVREVSAGGKMTEDQVMAAAKRVAAAGRGGDELLAYLSPESMAFLKSRGGSGTINPVTGLPEFKGGVLGKIFGSDDKPAPAPAAAPAQTEATERSSYAFGTDFSNMQAAPTAAQIRGGDADYYGDPDTSPAPVTSAVSSAQLMKEVANTPGMGVNGIGLNLSGQSLAPDYTALASSPSNTNTAATNTAAANTAAANTGTAASDLSNLTAAANTAAANTGTAASDLSNLTAANTANTGVTIGANTGTTTGATTGGTAANTLTADIARDLMQRSMTTGVPTSEFDKYGGYNAVKNLYNSSGGTYSLDEIDKGTLKGYATQVANTGVGNLSVLPMAGVALTQAGIDSMRRNGIDEATIANYAKQFGPLSVKPVSTTGALPLELAARMPGGFTPTNLSGTGRTSVSGYIGPQPGDFKSILSATPIGWDGRPAISRPSDNVATPGTTAPQGGSLTPTPVNLATNVPTFDYSNRGIGTAINQISLPNMGPIGQARDYVSATNPNNYFAQSRPSTPGLTAGTTALAPIDMPLAGAKTTLNTLGANPNLSPTMLGGQQNAGVMRDRLGNVIYSPGMPRFAKGGLAEVNAYNLSDEDEDPLINTDPVGSAQQMLSQLTQADKPSPTRQSVKRVAKSSGGASAAKEMDMKVDSLASAKNLVPQLSDKGSSRQQMEELARVYQLKINAAKDKARGLGASTFGAPTLEGPELTKNTLAKKRFKDGGEAKKSDAEVAEPSLFGVSDYATQASARMFPDQMGQDDQRDAARHMLAAGSVARKYGPKAADLLGKAHEYTSNPQTFFSALGIGEPRDDLPYDVHNNRIGAELAARATSQADLERLVKAMALQAQTKQTKDKPYIMSREKMDARKAKAEKGMTPPPEYRAEGSPEEGEVSQEELDAASKPAFVTPKSGIGRKRSSKPGELEAAALQGISETPYNLLGAPVDLATMVMRPFGYDVQAPMLGSEDLKRRATKAGIRQEPPKEGTAARALYNLSEIGASAVNPAAPVRAGMKAAKAVGDKATDVAKDFQQYNRQLSVPGASYVSRAPGGYFPTSRVEGGILSNLDKAFDPVLKDIRNIEDPEKRQALTMLFNQKAKDFFTKQAGSIEDPLRKDILSGALKFERSTPMGDAFPRVFQKGVAQGDLESLRLLEKNYDEMLNMQSTIPRRAGTDEIENVMTSQIMANMQANLDKIPDAQLLAYAGKKPGQGPTGVADVAGQIRQKLKDNPTLFSTVLEPRIAETLFVHSANVTDSDMARYPSLYGSPAVEAMTTPGARQPGFGEAVDEGFFLPEMQAAIDKGQPIQDIRSEYVRMLGMTPEKMLQQANQMAPEELNQMGFPDFLKKAYANTQQVDRFEKSIPMVKKTIEAGKVPPADIMTYGVKDFLPTAGDFRWVKVVKPDAVRAIAAGMNNSVASYAKSTTYGSLNKGRAALDSGEAEVYSLYDKNNVPHVTVEYLTAKPGVPDAKKNTIAQLTGNGPMTANAVPENYAPQIVDLLNNLRPSSMPPSIKKLLETTGQKEFLSEDALAPLYFGMPIEMLRGPQ